MRGPETPADQQAAPTVPTVTIEDYQALGIDRSDAQLLHDAAVAGIPGNLVLVASPDAGMAFEASRLAAATHLSGASAQLDIHLAVAAADRWAIAEVDDRVIRPAHLKAFDRTHIVVADADQMASAAYDHILKTVEEPASGAQFWFAVTNLDKIPVTLKGRSAATFTLRPAPVEDRIGLLEATGATPERAHRVAVLAGNDVRLAVAVAGNEALTEDLETFRTATVSSDVPTADADRLLAAIFRLAAALPAAQPAATEIDGTGEDAGATKTRRKPKTTKPAAEGPPKSAAGRPRWDSLPAPARPEARRLLRRLLERWAAETITAASSARNYAELARLDHILRTIDRAHRELATNAPAATALPALLARVNA